MNYGFLTACAVGCMSISCKKLPRSVKMRQSLVLVVIGFLLFGLLVLHMIAPFYCDSVCLRFRYDPVVDP